ncbi:MAG TPA: nuclear transport factor 2 family protein [Longimicrobium sp.]
MRIAVFAVLAALGACATVPAAPPPAPAALAPSAVHAELSGLEAELSRAIVARDTAVFHRVLAEDFALHAGDANGPAMPRAAWMTVMMERLRIDSAHVSDVRVVDTAGDTAQVELAFYWRGRAPGGNVIDQTLRLRDHWVRQGGRWRMVRRRTSQ